MAIADRAANAAKANFALIILLCFFLSGMSGLIYLVVSLALNALFLAHAVRLKRSDRRELPMQVFRFSVKYLMWLFLALLVDHYLPLRWM